MARRVPGRPAEMGWLIPGKITVPRSGRTGSVCRWAIVESWLVVMGIGAREVSRPRLSLILRLSFRLFHAVAADICNFLPPRSRSVLTKRRDVQHRHPGTVPRRGVLSLGDGSCYTIPSTSTLDPASARSHCLVVG